MVDATDRLVKTMPFCDTVTETAASGPAETRRALISCAAAW